MTKVKTILSEFCSAKDILAMNRLGLLKKEERETQPVPWRHRLNITERRELVKSEMRMSLRPPSRLSAKDKERAVSTAKTPKDSKMGETLLNIQIRGDPSLGKSIKRIHNEQHRQEQGHNQTQHLFLRRSQCLNHEPLILVERPASPSVKTRAMIVKEHGIDPKTASMPSYMRPLQSRCKTPSTLTTIDAFSVETKKKKNVWEEVMDEKESPKFKSAARPVTRLTEFEKQQLKLGHDLHKPTQESIAALAKAAAESKKRKDGRRTQSRCNEESDEDSDVSEAKTPTPPMDPTTFFITQSEATRHPQHPKPAFMSIAASAGWESGHISNKKPQPSALPVPKESVSMFPKKGRPKMTFRSLGRMAMANRARSVGGVHGSQTAHVTARPAVEISDKPKDKGKKAAMPSYQIPKGKERSEKKMKQFLSVLLDDS